MSLLSAALLWLAVLGGLAALLWWAYRRPPQVTLTREVPPNGFQGTRLPLTVRLGLRSRLPVRYLIEDPTPRTVVADSAVRRSGELLGEAELDLRATLTLNSRGVYDWPGATLHWADPLGLFWRSVPIAAAQRLAVFPSPHGLRLPDLLRPLLSEGGLSRQLGLDDPISLRSVREYASGDPPGRIHWRSSARTGTLSVREPERTAASSVTVYLDVSSGGDVFTESAVRLAASLVHEALALELPVSVATNGGATPTGRHAEALHAALLRLAQLQPDPAPPTIPPTRTGGNLIILSASPAPALIAGAMRARATASRVAIVAMPEGFYLEPGETPRRQWVAAPDSVRNLERQAGVLAGAGILVFVLRGNQSVLRLGG
ncbi:DUF58 domain-containing protein [Deinococcus radiopugnans]|uniref:DUF58 domain-containing protein n=1 Tax=Deinococcus radiopugnans ATCC 19172 TaxID=585398 RepID=A0A5C4Y4R4_9DEIO|nr:DUF58 domain-containing protein [Deinococcus radiopugnans]MBB6016696.1 uncharacterized protein (DUF58 family) [Deinococcus radiopugnans ATCC 19172]TNM70808.1 DUF58 domain-containing protein [Deinococcus radiopugnans ATCC 19172]